MCTFYLLLTTSFSYTHFPSPLPSPPLFLKPYIEQLVLTDLITLLLTTLHPISFYFLWPAPLFLFHNCYYFTKFKPHHFVIFPYMLSSSLLSSLTSYSVPRPGNISLLSNNNNKVSTFIMPKLRQQTHPKLLLLISWAPLSSYQQRMLHGVWLAGGKDHAFC